MEDDRKTERQWTSSRELADGVDLMTRPPLSMTFLCFTLSDESAIVMRDYKPGHQSPHLAL
jgi:hypothetical protein